jgi:hypothetical protein
MKNSLLLTLIITATILQSCDERITPKKTPVKSELPVTPPVLPTPSTMMETLTAKSWLYSEVLVRGGGKTVVQFSRPTSTGLSSDFALTKVTYKKDGSHEEELKGSVNKGKWATAKDQKQLTIIDSGGAETVFDVVSVSKTKLEISVTFKKGNTTDADWLSRLESLGLPETSMEITVVFSFVPI